MQRVWPAGKLSIDKERQELENYIRKHEQDAASSSDAGKLSDVRKIVGVFSKAYLLCMCPILCVETRRTFCTSIMSIFIPFLLCTAPYVFFQ